MGFVVLWESLLLLRLLRIPNLTSASPWFPPRFPLCLLPHRDRKSQIFFWTNLMYFFLPSLFCLSPSLPEGEGLFLSITGHGRAFWHHFQGIPCLRSPRKNLLRFDFCLRSLITQLCARSVPVSCLAWQSFVIQAGGSSFTCSKGVSVKTKRNSFSASNA